jgi:polyisoprenoid-binding protein YceI
MKLIKFSGLMIASALLMFSCGGGGDTVETSEAEEVKAGSGQTLTIAPESSKVNWRGYKPKGQHYGIIPVTNGQLMVENNAITGGNFSFDITKLEIHDLEEGSENHGKLFGHLQSDDFFDAAKHPEAKFEITDIEAYSPDELEDKDEYETENTPKSSSELAPSSPTHWVKGNLTMRGTTKNIKFPAHISINDSAVEAKAGFNIDRTEWGLSYNDEGNVVDRAKDQFIYNSVSVEFDIKAN